MQSQVYFVSSSRQVNISGVSFVRQKARVTSLMLSVVMSLLLVVASGPGSCVCGWQRGGRRAVQCLGSL